MKLIKIIIISILFMFAFSSVSFAEENPSVFYNASAVIQLNLKDRPRTEVVRVVGSLDGKNNNIEDVDGDGKLDSETEIVNMSLSGVSSRGLAVNLNSSKSNRSMGRAEQLVSMSRASIPANSFFDVFIELSYIPPNNSVVSGVVPNEVLTSCEKVHILGISKSLTNLSGVYRQRMSGKITLCNLVGEPAGSLSLFAISLNSSKSN